MADNINHNSVEVTNEVVNEKLHLEGPKNPGYYKISKFMNDYSAIFHQDPENINVKGRYKKDVYT